MFGPTRSLNQISRLLVGFWFSIPKVWPDPVSCSQRKEAGLPIVKKLRELSGSDDFDKAAVKILEDTARAVSR